MVRLRPPRDCNEHGSGRLARFSHLAGDLVTIEPWHPKIEEGNLGPEADDHLECTRAIGRHSHFVSLRSKDEREGFGGVRIVVSDHDSARLHASVLTKGGRNERGIVRNGGHS